MNEWISVDDALPIPEDARVWPPTQRYVVWCPSLAKWGREISAAHFVIYNGSAKWLDGGYELGVTHWMEAPEGPW